MKYVIEEEELKDFVKNPLAYKFVDDFLKSKSPVKEIAEGEVKIVKSTNNKTYIDIGEMWTEVLFRRYIGKNIRIYIEVIK